MSVTSDQSGSHHFRERFRELQLSQDSSSKIITDLITYCERIESSFETETHRYSQQIEELRLDLVDATKSRRVLQQQARAFETDIGRLFQENENIKNRNPYVAILIDGDGLIFQDQFIKAGIEGGKKAAYALRSAVADQCGEHAHEIEISAHIVANLDGLSRAMIRDGAIDNVNTLRDFMQGFSQAKASFNFIDIGYGKERADSKIKETAKWHLQNINCRQILLGVSHDAGYAPFLDEILRDDTTRKRVTVLEGVPTTRDIVLTAVNIFRLENDLFRTKKLVDRIVTVPSVPSLPSSNGTSPKVASETPNSTVSSAAPSVSSPFSTFAQATAQKAKPASPPPQITMPLAPRSGNAAKRAAKEPASSQPKWDPGARGLDKPIAVNQTVLDTVKRRKESNKLCNNHFLRGPCSKGDSCTFVHNYKPSPDEIDAIAFLSRLNPCTSGQDCDAEDCIYGHHCPNVKDGYCTHPYCKFPEEAHPPGTNYRNAFVSKNF